MLFKRTVLFVLAAALATAAVAQDGVKLVRTAKVGSVQNFTVAAELEVMGMAITFSAKVAEKVVAVDADGTYTVEATQSDIKVMANGSEMPGGQVPPATTSKYKATGELLEIKGQDLVPDDVRRSNMTAFVAPTDPVKVGTKWNTEVKATEASGGIGGKAEFEAVAEETLGSVRTLKISFKYAETSGDTPGTASGFIWIDVADGSVVKLQASYVNAPLPAAGGPVNMKVVITRV